MLFRSRPPAPFRVALEPRRSPFCACSAKRTTFKTTSRHERAHCHEHLHNVRKQLLNACITSNGMKHDASVARTFARLGRRFEADSVDRFGVRLRFLQQRSRCVELLVKLLNAPAVSPSGSFVRRSALLAARTISMSSPAWLCSSAQHVHARVLDALHSMSLTHTLHPAFDFIKRFLRADIEDENRRLRATVVHRCHRAEAAAMQVIRRMRIQAFTALGQQCPTTAESR